MQHVGGDEAGAVGPRGGHRPVQAKQRDELAMRQLPPFKEAQRALDGAVDLHGQLGGGLGAHPAKRSPGGSGIDAGFAFGCIAPIATLLIPAYVVLFRFHLQIEVGRVRQILAAISTPARRA